MISKFSKQNSLKFCELDFLLRVYHGKWLVIERPLFIYDLNNYFLEFETIKVTEPSGLSVKVSRLHTYLKWFAF